MTAARWSVNRSLGPAHRRTAWDNSSHSIFGGTDG